MLTPVAKIAVLLVLSTFASSQDSVRPSTFDRRRTSGTVFGRVVDDSKITFDRRRLGTTYWGLSQLTDRLRQLSTQYPALLRCFFSLDDVLSSYNSPNYDGGEGNSFVPRLPEAYLSRTYEGRDIIMCRISTSHYKGATRVLPNDMEKSEFVIVGGMHAREWISPEATIGMMESLLEGYFVNSRVRAALQQLEFIFFPILNPDGYHYSRTVDPLWRKNRRRMTATEYGVDLNRNFDFDWGGAGASADVSDEDYHGPAPVSEAETRFLTTLLTSQRVANDVVYVTSMHSFGQELQYPWGHSTVEYSPIDQKMQLLFNRAEQAVMSGSGRNGGAVRNSVRYGVVKASDAGYVISGDLTDWAHRTFGPYVPALNVELRPKFPLRDIDIDDNFFLDEAQINDTIRENFALLMYLADHQLTAGGQWWLNGVVSQIDEDQDDDGIVDYEDPCLSSGSAASDPLPNSFTLSSWWWSERSCARRQGDRPSVLDPRNPRRTVPLTALFPQRLEGNTTAHTAFVLCQSAADLRAAMMAGLPEGNKSQYDVVINGFAKKCQSSLSIQRRPIPLCQVDFRLSLTESTAGVFRRVDGVDAALDALIEMRANDLLYGNFIVASQFYSEASERIVLPEVMRGNALTCTGYIRQRARVRRRRVRRTRTSRLLLPFSSEHNMAVTVQPCTVYIGNTASLSCLLLYTIIIGIVTILVGVALLYYQCHRSNSMNNNDFPSK